MKHQNRLYWLLGIGASALLLILSMVLAGQPAYAGFTPTPTPTNTPTPQPTATPTLTPPPPPPPPAEITPTPTPLPLLPESGGEAPSPLWLLWVAGATALLLGWALRGAVSRHPRTPE
jgi:hypothetical protein